MENVKAFLSTILIIFLCLSVASCKRGITHATTAPYKFDTVNFLLKGTNSLSVGPAPQIYIDTNIEVSGLTGGTVKSSKPYSVKIDFTDETLSFSKAELKKVEVIYEDGTTDSGIAGLALPIIIPARPYEIINSGTGGSITKSNVRLVSGELPDIISRDEPLSVHIEGSLVKDNGTVIPFEIHEEYEVKIDTGTKAWQDVMLDK